MNARTVGMMLATSVVAMGSLGGVALTCADGSVMPASGHAAMTSLPSAGVPPGASPEAQGRLALRGLDPVLLVKGEEQAGQAEHVSVHKAYRYQFVSDANRVAFERAPGTFVIPNETCPVVPGAPIDPGLFVVHDGKVYAFAATDCVAEFKANPAAFVRKPQ